MPDRVSRWASLWLALTVVIAVAACLRYPALDQTPPGLNFDEGGEGVAALDVMHGTYRLWWPIGGGKEPLMAYLVQPLFWVFGPTRLALRLYTATMGVIAAAGTFWLALEMVTSPSGIRSRRLRPSALVVPLLAGLGLATAFWHVAYSRIAFRALAMPAVEALALAWFWHAMRRPASLAGRSPVPTAENGGDRWCTSGWQHFMGAGAFIGLCAYTYLAGRFVPLAIVLFLVLEAVIALFTGQRPLVVRQWRGLLVTAVSALAVFSPLGVFFVGHPSAFLERAGSVSIFSPAWNQGHLFSALLNTIAATLGTFAGLTGDPNPLGNLPGQPMLPLPLAFLFWVGIAACVWKVIGYLKHALLTGVAISSESPLPYLFLLCWWPIMLLPGVLAPEGAPHHLRLIGTAPATYTLIALGCVQLACIIRRRLPPGRRTLHLAPRQATRAVEAEPEQVRHSGGRAVMTRLIHWQDSLRPAAWLILPLVLFLPVGLVTAKTYFGRWAQLPDLYMAFDVYAVQLAQEIAADDAPNVAYAIPMDLRAAHEARHYTLDFMVHGHTPYHYLPVDDRTAAEELTKAADGAETLRVVRWSRDKHVAADEREVVTYLLATVARLQGEETRPAYRVETWALPSAHTVFQLPTPDQPVNAVFGDRLELTAAHLATGEGWMGVALRWRPLAAMETDYKASLRLVAQDGNPPGSVGGTVVAQKDRFLRHNWHQGTSLWPAETVDEYYLLQPVPPGNYEVRVVVYDPDSLAPLIVSGQGELAVGVVTLPGAAGDAINSAD
jgi:hypothetical protein